MEVDDCSTLSYNANMVQSQDVGELWHRILGHLHHEALKIMQQISTELPKGKLEQMTTCKGCNLGKYAKYSFSDRDSRAREILERVHSDVCGPFSTTSLLNKDTMLFLLMIFLVDAGSTLCKIRIGPS